jgi:DMSO/TMAO reductase YedYZ molybdopterin-dependent catalytic subunit
MKKIVNRVVMDMTADEIAEAEAQQVEWADGENDRLAENVRNQRDRLLAETDWMALSDVTMSDTMTAYRQALRDIPSQAGFPFSVTWPTKPE